ncbi:MAG: phosphoribosylamine--glycine ligase [Thermoplasmata archaeon]|nr:phosphoribosylamine--glycine ligase [Thermoplasmata archaeon]
MYAKVLLIGGGGREHAIAAALHRSGAKLFAAMRNRNPGIMRLAEKVKIVPENDLNGVCEFATAHQVDFAVCGPEDPLVNGLADALRQQGIPCVGPLQSGARIEGSKLFARELMKNYRIPGCVDYRMVGSLEEAKRAFNEFNGNFVIKPIGLTGGKGVKVMGEHLKNIEDAVGYARDIIEKKIGQSQNLLVEEKIEGEEFTLQAFVNEKSVQFSPLVQDHKRLFEGDTGPNTGGMGSYSCEDFILPFITERDYEMAKEIIFRTVEALNREGINYRGFLYGQFMAARDGVKVIEFNCRLGDPEATNVLTLITSDFTDLCWRIANGESFAQPEFERKATVCKYLVPEGYGIKPLANEEITVNEQGIIASGCVPYYAMVNEENGRIYTTTSRAVAVVSPADTVSLAEKNVENALKHVHGKLFVRHDIGKMELIRKRIEHMKRIRGKETN